MNGNGTNDALRNVGWALIRMAMGGFFATHGYAKIFGLTDEGELRMATFYAAVEKLGFPYPEAFAWAASLTELVGGTLIAIGLLTRPAAFLAFFTMCVAVYSHREQGFSGMEKALMYLVVFFSLALGGSGPLAFDEWIRQRRAKASASIFR